MNSHHIFHWLFALFFVCASITQSKAIAQTKCSENQFQASEGMKQMTRAIRLGDVAKVKGLLAKGFDLTERDESCRTALTYAVMDGRIEIARGLIDYGANVNVQNHNGASPLWYASFLDRADMVELLLSAGADANIKDDIGQTALMFAVQTVNIEMIRNLLSRGAKVDDRAFKGETALMCARLGAVDVLIGAGADVNAVDKGGHTALMYAVVWRQEDKVEKLLRAGADVNIKAKDGHTALGLAKKDSIGNSPIEQLLRQFGAIE
jgi:ankyrin repeat protein